MFNVVFIAILENIRDTRWRGCVRYRFWFWLFARHSENAFFTIHMSARSENWVFANKHANYALRIFTFIVRFVISRWVHSDHNFARSWLHKRMLFGVLGHNGCVRTTIHVTTHARVCRDRCIACRTCCNAVDTCAAKSVPTLQDARKHVQAFAYSACHIF